MKLENTSGQDTSFPGEHEEQATDMEWNTFFREIGPWRPFHAESLSIPKYTSTLLWAGMPVHGDTYTHTSSLMPCFPQVAIHSPLDCAQPWVASPIADVSPVAEVNGLFSDGARQVVTPQSFTHLPGQSVQQASSLSVLKAGQGQALVPLEFHARAVLPHRTSCAEGNV